jgi:MFS transporter, DHA1 family, multidrug resistance protein
MLIKQIDNSKILPFLMGMVILSILETDLYLASFISLSKFFKTSQAAIQSSLYLYLTMLALGILFVGTLSDVYGRRKVFLVGIGIDLFGSILCCISTFNTIFLIGRTFQALGACTGTVLARVVVRDCFQGESCRAALAYLFTGVSVSVAIVPALGGFIEQVIGWQGNFVFLSIFQFLLLIGAYLFVPETNLALVPKFSFRQWRKKVVQVFKKPSFRYYAGLITLAWSGFFAFVGGSSFLFMKVLKIEPFLFGILFAIIMVGMIAGTLISGKIFNSWPLHQSITVGIICCVCGGVLLCFIPTFSPWKLSIGMILYQLGTGILLPLCQVGATEEDPSLTSTIFSLLYFSKMLGASLAGFLLSFLNTYWTHALPFFVGAFSFFCLFVYLRMKQIKIFNPVNNS